MNCWTLRTRGRALRVDIQATALEAHEEDAIVDAVEAEAATGNFDVVHVTGSMLDAPPIGTLALIRRLGESAFRHGKRLDVGPI